MTETNDKQEQRDQWVGLLNAGWMFHQAVSVAIRDAINLIQQMEAMGYFDTEEDVLLSKPGPMG